MPIDIGPDNLATVLSILEHLVPGREVRAFGSRVAGKAKAFSDLDLAVIISSGPNRALEIDLGAVFAE